MTPRLAMSLMTRPAWCFKMSRAGPLRINNIKDRPEFGARVLEQASRIAQEIDASLTWDDLKCIRERWKGKLVVKGVMTAEDASRCSEIGADALVVSNHGGRQLDCAPSTISVLPKIVSAVGTKLDVMMDGGVRRVDVTIGRMGVAKVSELHRRRDELLRR